MFRTVKLAACAAILAAFTTAAHANLIVEGPIINNSDSFSATFHYYTGGTGPNTYSSPDGSNWDVDLTAGAVIFLGASLTMQHALDGFGPSGAGAISTLTLSGITPGGLLSGNTTTFHPNIPTLTDVITLTLTQPVGANVIVITVTGTHTDTSAVPDAASTVMLLGLGLTGLGTARRLVRL